jgi:hypothetical protein
MRLKSSKAMLGKGIAGFSLILKKRFANRKLVVTFNWLFVAIATTFRPPTRNPLKSARPVH